jgi:hypothetical protein
MPTDPVFDAEARARALIRGDAVLSGRATKAGVNRALTLALQLCREAQASTAREYDGAVDALRMIAKHPCGGGAFPGIGDRHCGECAWCIAREEVAKLDARSTLQPPAARETKRPKLCGKYLGDNDATCPQISCIRTRGHEGLCDNVRGDAPAPAAPPADAETLERASRILWERRYDMDDADASSEVAGKLARQLRAAPPALEAPTLRQYVEDMRDQHEDAGGQFASGVHWLATQILDRLSAGPAEHGRPPAAVGTPGSPSDSPSTEGAAAGSTSQPAPQPDLSVASDDGETTGGAQAVHEALARAEDFLDSDCWHFEGEADRGDMIEALHAHAAAEVARARPGIWNEAVETAAALFKRLMLDALHRPGERAEGT